MVTQKRSPMVEEDHMVVDIRRNHMEAHHMEAHHMEDLHNNVDRYHKSHAKLFPNKIVERFQSKIAIMPHDNNAPPSLAKSQNNNADRYPSRNANPSQDKNANLYHVNNVDQFPDKNVLMSLANNAKMYQGNNVETFQDKNVKMFQDNNVEMFQGRNVKTFPDSSVEMFHNRNARMS